MELEVVTVGTELLLGHTLDSNAADLGRALAEVGVRVVRRATVGDDADAIREAVTEALGRTGFVITTGGLGPTSDDITKDAVAGLFGLPLELDDAYLAELEARFASFRRGPMPERNRSQALVPRGATLLPNPRGTAPGLWIEGPPGTVVLLPGIPPEMRAMVRDAVVPRLAAKLAGGTDGSPVTRSRTLRTTGITEAALAGLLEGAEAVLAPLTLAYLPGLDGVDLRITAWARPDDEVDTLLARAAEVLYERAGRHVYGEEDTDLAAVVLERLGTRGLRLAVAESCTGGLIGARLTAVPGASEVFLGGVLAYADEVKRWDLDLPKAVLASAGAVSREAAVAMVEGVTRRFRAEAGLAATGIAGPGGGSADKPVGTVWLAGKVGDRVEVVRQRYPGTRREVRHRAAQSALDLLRGLLAEEVG